MGKQMHLWSETLATTLVVSTLLYVCHFISATKQFDMLTKEFYKNIVPGPWYSRWTGVVLKYKWLSGQRPVYVHQLHQKYGPVVRIAPNEVAVIDADATKTIYDSKETFKKSRFYRDLTAVRSPVLFSLVDVTTHRRLRRLMSTPISASSLRQYRTLVQSRIDLYLGRIREEMDARGAVDVFKWDLFLATDVVAELSFGESSRTLEDGERNQYVHLVENIGPLGAIRSAFPGLASYAFLLPFPVIKSVAAASQNVRRFGAESLSRLYRLSDTASAAHRPPRDFLFSKLRESEQKGDISFDEICANAGGYILAGSDTTASTLTYLVWSVCRRPALRDRLVRQLREALHESADDESIDDDALRAVPCLSHVIDETLRLYAAAPSGLPREIPAVGAHLAGYNFDSGTVISAQAYSMHRDPDVFPDPDEFEPSRWEEPSKAMLEAFMPFGRGPRTRMELRMAAASFFLTFPNVKPSSREGFSDKDMKPRMFFVSNPVGKRCLVEV